MALVPIGRIVNTHGLKGEVRILPATDFKEDRYRTGNVLFVETPSGRRELVVERFRPHRGFDLLSFRGCPTIESVLPFKGLVLYAADDAPIGLKANEFRAADLVGLAVLQGDRPVGTVSGIRTYPQGDYLEIRKNDGAQALVPFVDALVPAVDVKARTVRVAEMEGLL